MKTDRDWDERFGGSVQSPQGSDLWDYQGSELDAILAMDLKNVWTVIEGDETENQYLVPGIARVNRIGHIVAEKPITEEELATGEWSEVLWFDAADLIEAPKP